MEVAERLPPRCDGGGEELGADAAVGGVKQARQRGKLPSGAGVHLLQILQLSWQLRCDSRLQLRVLAVKLLLLAVVLGSPVDLAATEPTEYRLHQTGKAILRQG